MTDRQAVDPIDLVASTVIDRRQWLIFTVCALLMMLEGFDVQAMAFVAPVLASRWHVASATFGPVFSAGLFGGILGGALIAPLGDRFGARTVLVVSTFFFGLFTLVTASANSLIELIVLRVLAGIGITAAVPCIIAILSSYSPSRFQAVIVVAAFCFQLFGAVVGGLLAAMMIPAFGWASVFVLGGIAPILLVPVAYALLPDPVTFLLRNDRTQQITHVLRKMRKLPEGNNRFIVADVGSDRVGMQQMLRREWIVPTMFLWSANVLGVLFFYFLANWIPSIMRDGGAPLRISVIGNVLLNAGGIVGALSLSRALSRMGMTRTIGLGYIAGGLLIFAVGIKGMPIPAMLLLVFLCGLAGLGAQCCSSALVLRLYPTHLHSTAIGSTFAFGRLGAVLGPLIGTYMLRQGAEPRQLFYFAALPAVVAGLCILGIRLPSVNRRA